MNCVDCPNPFQSLGSPTNQQRTNSKSKKLSQGSSGGSSNFIPGMKFGVGRTTKSNSLKKKIKTRKDTYQEEAEGLEVGPNENERQMKSVIKEEPEQGWSIFLSQV
jgi:hypothetical protein